MNALHAGKADPVTETAHPFAAARDKLFSPLRNRVLGEALDALAENNIAVAESLVEKHLVKKPNDPEALNLRADIARRLHKFDDAEQYLSRCLAISPRCAGYRYNYAVVLRSLHRYCEALVQIEGLLKSDPENPLYLDQKATILSWLGRPDEALGYRRGLAEKYPTSSEMWMQYGHALRDTGFQERSVAAFRRALELLPSLTSAYASLASLKVYRFTQAEIEGMEQQLRMGALDTEKRADLHIALGKAYGDAADFAKSFENYAKGNALRRINTAFDTEHLKERRLKLESAFSQKLFSDRAGWGCPSNAPIFIIGMPRSGSTLLEQILASHSAIEGLGEMAHLDAALLMPLTTGHDKIRLEEFANGNAVDKGGLVNAYIDIVEKLNEEVFCKAGEEYVKSVNSRRVAGRPFFTDKTLRNFYYTGLIHLILPNARIIETRRHPLDCCWSCFTSEFPGHNYANRLSDLGHDYVNYARLMNHFERVLPGRVHRVTYEELVTDTEGVVRRLFDYLQLPFEAGCLRFYENKRPVMTQSSEQVRTPVYASGMGQWRPYEKWLAPLKAALGSVLESYPQPPPQAD